MDEKALLDAIRSIVREEVKAETEPLKADIAELKADISVMKEDIGEIKEHTTITRETVNDIGEWTEIASDVLKISYPLRKAE